MSRRCKSIAPTRSASVSPTSSWWVSLRRGGDYPADISDRINEGAVYMTYQWWVGACNELTQDNLDPISKTPETKYCAVKVEAIADQRWAEQYAWTSYSEMKRLKAAT
jgi:formate dehydrogenase major subunit